MIDPCNQVIGRGTPSGHHLFLCQLQWNSENHMLSTERRENPAAHLEPFWCLLSNGQSGWPNLAYCEYNNTTVITW
jgi:hypothetical protein